MKIRGHGLQVGLALTLVMIALAAVGSTIAVGDDVDEGDDTTSGEVLIEKLNKQWDDKVGLWRGSTKLGPQGHDIRSNAGKLVQAANLGVLDQVDYERVLVTIRKAQETKGNYRGNFWWAWGLGKVTDKNSGFFTTIELLALHYEHRDKLSDKAKADLDHMLREAIHWFRNKVYPIREDKLRYPNAYFGDAMCLWLLSEIDGKVDEKLRKDFHRIMRYYLDKDWGWGEHLSDMYSKVLQRELVALLMWQKKLTPEMARDARAMLNELCQIDAWFDGGPTVPAVRNYWIDRSPGTGEKRPSWFRSYLDLMTDKSQGRFAIAHLGHKHGIHKQIEVTPRVRPDITVDTYDNGQALAWIDERWRIGVQSHYPFFPDMQTRGPNGMAWHAMPVAFWHVDGDWIYLQWAVEEGGKVRAHPAMGRNSVRDDHVARLSDDQRKSCVANTFGIRDGRQFLAMRVIPDRGDKWPWAEDRVRMIAGTHGEPKTDEINGWHRIVLPYEKETLTIAWTPIVGDSRAVSSKQGGHQFWGARLDGEAIRKSQTMATLWFLTVADGPVTPPAVKGSGAEREVTLESGKAMRLNARAKRPWSPVKR